MKALLWIAGAVILAALAGYNFLLASTPPQATALVDDSGNEIVAMADSGEFEVTPRAFSIRSTRQRPLFIQTRRPFVPEPEPAPKPPKPQPVQAAKPVQPPPPPPDIRLFGVQLTPQGHKALISESNSDAPDWIAEGQGIGGWSVHAISSEGLEIRLGKERRLISLHPEQAQ